MEQVQIDRYGDELYDALVRRASVEPLSGREPGITIEDAYRIQLCMVQRRVDVLQGPGVSAADVMRASDHVLPCFEIVDSRIKGWKIKIQDTVADNASCGVLVLGSARGDPRELDLGSARMVLRKNGAVVSTSTGAAVQGSPLNAVAWLANTLGRLGITLKAGEVILSGSQSPLVPVVAGDSLQCEVEGLGRASVRFI